MAKVGFIVDEMYEDSELEVPLQRVKDAGHEAVIIGLQADKKLKGKKGKLTVRVEKAVTDVDADELDAPVIPGGYSPDHLRMNERAVDLVREIDEANKPLAVVCHGPWMLAEADIADGRRLPSWPGIQTDLINAGADWVDEPVVVDGNLITSRMPDDLGVFSDALLRALEEGAGQERGDERAAGGEGEGRPETRDIGGLQQRDYAGKGDDIDIHGPGEDEEHITRADVDMRRRNAQGAQPDRAPDAARELSPDDLE
jgi:protease I